MRMIAFINQTTVLQDEQISAIIQPMTLFLADVAAVWGVEVPKLVLAADNGLTISYGVEPFYLQDTTNVPGAGGYHVDQDDVPQGYVFVKDAMDADEEWTVDVAHELAEMLIDPLAGDDGTPIVDLLGMPGYACLPEVCDAVENDAYAYEIEGVKVSDFVTPEYFFMTRPNGYQGKAGKYDFMGVLTRPAPALMPDGYLGIRDPDGNWSQVSDFTDTGMFSRRALRTMGRLARMQRAVVGW